ncbi:MAG: MmcQ/YjbR family DNA-binding protein [Bacteroidia bacterium]|nr:MmcQ/YjbR family DNA-binding protein [Bacteroidia bacterium]
MNIEQIRQYCLAKKGVEECLPFGPDTLVMKVVGKMFLLAGLDEHPVEINLKFDADKMDELRAAYPCIIPGYHMNKRHWNTVICDGSVPDALIRSWIDRSYELVTEGLSKKLKSELRKL